MGLLADGSTIGAVYSQPAVKRWGPDWVMGIVRDELDREEIHRYRILVGAGSGS